MFAQRKKKDKEEPKIETTIVATPLQGLQNSSDSLSYAFGVQTATNMKNQGVEKISIEAFSNGAKENIEGTAKMTNEQAIAYIKSFYAEKQKIEGEANKIAGIKFLENNKSKEGVTTLESGLQYKVLNKGTSAIKPTLTDKVKTHYHGTLIDGTVFDSSVDRGQPATFPVSNVIRGWVEALQLMNVGDKWELYVPYELAYNSRATGKIKPYSTLIIQVELLSIEK